MAGAGSTVAVGRGAGAIDMEALSEGGLPRACYKGPANEDLCWGCFTAQYPERAKLKVRKEHLILAELQRRLPWLGERATQLVWDCPVPGGCTLNMLYRFEDRFVQVEVDEEGHEDTSCADEDSRLELIAADVGLPGLVLRLNPDAERILKRRRCSNGEPCFCVGDADAFTALFDAAETEVETLLLEEIENFRHTMSLAEAARTATGQCP
ncbi:hypothetical protein AK812_SmicGene22830 [Symbiodinium microadriaticum]|uniref:Uncharacterized protein n=1 Tax=Symbiodinium microadriaticum TaxID=2951 RepID=A0A1Q9DIV6_SYMMI|nr:hypothetical protein AK812_SmicGene22830 [Symbiodinium microadriaticum]